MQGLILTDAGAAEIEAAYLAGTVVNIVTAAFGDGGGAPVEADPSVTELVGRFGEEPFAAGGSDTGMIGGVVVIQAEAYPGQTLREFGLMSESGTLIAYGAYPDTWLPTQNDSIIKEITVKFVMPLVHAECVTLEVDPNIAVITQETGDKRYLRQALCLQEIADQGEEAQAQAHEHLALGSAATHDVTTSPADTTAGRVMQIGDGGLLGRSLSVTDANLADKAGLISMLFNQGGGSNSIHFGSYGCGVHLHYGDSGDGSQAMSANLFVDSSGNLSVEWLAIKKADGAIASQRIQKLFGPLNKPAASDVDAVSASQGGTFQKSVTFNQGLTSKGQVAWGDYAHNLGEDVYNAMVNVYDAGGKMRWAFGPYKGGWSIYSYNPDGSYKANLLNIDFTTQNATFAGQVIPTHYNNFDERYLYDVQLGAVVTTNGESYTAPAGHVLVGIGAHGGNYDTQIDNFKAKPVQKKTRTGSFVNIAG